jgi:hypothetical protein
VKLRHLLVVLALASTAAGADITASALAEISGIALAQGHDGFWVHNDSGDLPRLYAIDRAGNHLATVLVTGANAIDWEDMCACSINGVRYLVVADMGDNLSVLPERALYAIVEPQLTGTEDPNKAVKIPLAWSLRYRLPIGPADAEGLAFDARARRFLVLTKRTEPAQLFSLPEQGAPDLVHVAQFEAPLPAPTIPDSLRKQKGAYAAEAHFPTALDCSIDGSALLVTNYVQLLYYRRAANESWAQALRRSPQLVPIPVLMQTEAVCFDGASAVIASEQLPATMVTVPLP